MLMFFKKGGKQGKVGEKDSFLPSEHSISCEKREKQNREGQKERKKRKKGGMLMMCMGKKRDAFPVEWGKKDMQAQTHREM